MSSIFGAEDPIALARSWLADAEKSEVNDPNAMALATVDADGLPNVRMVLLKEIEDDAFVFYTNYESAKGRELARKCPGGFRVALEKPAQAGPGAGSCQPRRGRTG